MSDGTGPLRAWRELPDVLLADRFELLGEVGCGGMGTVYRARDATSGEIVALKVILPGSAGDAARFARECAILAGLSHPAIVRYVAHGETSDGEPWLAMEWLEGESLSRRLARGPLEWREAARIGRDVACALDAAHASGVIHRDLKPGNLFLTAGGAVKVLDFGIARPRVPADGLTKTGQIVGTPGYMAPEQARGDKGLDAQADVFALGCVLYHLVSGEPPFHADDVLTVLARLVLEEPPRLAKVAPGTPRALDALVHGMMAKAPGDRPKSAAEVRDALDRILRGEGIAAPEAETARRTRDRREAPSDEPEAETIAPGIARESLPTMPRPAREPRRGALVLAGLVGAAALLAVAAVAFFRPAVVSPPEPAAAARAPDGVALVSACEAWAEALAYAQRPDGSFGTERHREGWGWTTGQELLALARARDACGAPGEEVLRRGAAALDRLRGEEGWRGSGERAETPAVAWAALAYAAMAEELDDGALAERARGARDLLLDAQRDDGAFSFWIDGGELNAYSSVMALWALAEVAPLGEDERAREARARAARWLSAALDRAPAGAAIRDTAGLDEQAAWVLLRAVGAHEARASLAASARRTAVRCRMSAAGECRHPLHENGETHLGPDGTPELVTLWRPWAALSAARLSELDLPAPARASSRAVAQWARASLTRDVEQVTLVPSYQLAEHLFVITELARE